MPKNLKVAEITLDLLNRLCDTALYKLNCNKNKDAFILAFNTLTGENYED